MISNYALKSDFVHELLYQLPGSHQYYTEGYGVDGIGQNHAPMGFFEQNDNFSKKWLEKDFIVYELLGQIRDSDDEERREKVAKYIFDNAHEALTVTPKIKVAVDNYEDYCKLNN